jgi:hypothetical protein
MAKLNFFPQYEGFAFVNSWMLDASEKRTVIDLIDSQTPTAIAAVTPVLLGIVNAGAPVVDAFGLLIGIPPGVLTGGANAAVASLTAAWPAIVHGWLESALANYNYGLCGGMAYSAFDYWRLNWVVSRGFPDQRDQNLKITVGGQPQRNTTQGTELRGYIWQRLVDSFVTGNVASRTIEWMIVQYLFPSQYGGPMELARRTGPELMLLKRYIDAGTPWPIALVRDTANPADNHQILAYGYESLSVPGGTVERVYVYDNNEADNENFIDVTFAGGQIAGLTESIRTRQTETPPLRGFFCSGYSPKAPPVALGVSQGLTATPSSPLVGQTSAFSFEATNRGFGPTPNVSLCIRAPSLGIGAPALPPTFAAGEPNQPIGSLVTISGAPSGATVKRSTTATAQLPLARWTISTGARLDGTTLVKSVPALAQGTHESIPFQVRVGWDSGIRGAILWNNGKAYFFRGNQYIRYDVASDHVDLGYPITLPTHWPGLWADRVDAAVMWNNGKAYLFRGSEYIRYDVASDRTDPGYPRSIAGNWPGLWADGVDAGILWNNSTAYFFKGSQYVRYDVATDRVMAGYPLPIAGHWPGLFTDGIDSAVMWNNGRAYFFRGTQYSRYDPAADRVDPGYPRPIVGNWPGF